MDLTILNTAKEDLIAKQALAGLMPVDINRYYIPYDEVLAIFTETASILTELNGRIITLEGQMSNRMLCKEYKVE